MGLKLRAYKNFSVLIDLSLTGIMEARFRLVVKSYIITYICFPTDRVTLIMFINLGPFIGEFRS